MLLICYLAIPMTPSNSLGKNMERKIKLKIMKIYKVEFIMAPK